MSDNALTPIFGVLKDLVKMIAGLRERIEDLEYMHNNASVMQNHDVPERFKESIKHQHTAKVLKIMEEVERRTE